ncbi:MAG: hypothetical protein JO148_16725 [Acidimicrobiia bacterium]|nr:hypothetical protein [Acidimicrobiia bacterium]
MALLTIPASVLSTATRILFIARVFEGAGRTDREPAWAHGCRDGARQELT